MAVPGVPIEITRFVNPHLFWMVNREDVSKRINLEEQLESSSISCSAKNLRVGQYVLVNDDLKWKRAIVREIKYDYVTYWLMDYGTQLDYSDDVFVVPKEFTRLEPLAKQAALKDVVSVKQTFAAFEIKIEHVAHFTVGSVKCFKEHFNNAQEISFLYVEMKGNIQVGEINLKNSNGAWYNVAQILVDEAVVAFNAQFFETALAENTKSETAFMESSTANVKDLQNLLNLLQEYPQQGKGRGVAPPQVSPNKHSSGIVNKENVLKTPTKFEEFHDVTKDLPTTDSSSSSTSISEKRKNALSRLKEQKAKLAKSINQSSELDCSTDSERQLNLSNSSEKFARSSKIVMEPKTKSMSDSGSEKSYTTAKSNLSEFEEQDQSNSLTETPSIKCALKRLQKLKASKREEGGEQNITESSTGTSSRTEQLETTSDSSSISSASVLHKSSSFENKGQSCKFGCKCDKCFGCKCPRCYSWTYTEMYDSKTHDVVQTCKKTENNSKVIEKPPLLLKNEQEKIDAKFMKSYSSIVKSKSKVQLASMSKILIHGLSFPLPVSSILSVPFHSNIQKAMKNYETIFTLQSYVWPALMRSMNVCMVNSPKTGKTIAYMPAVLSYLLERDSRYLNLPKNSKGPIVIILCPKVKMAEEIIRLALQLLTDVKKKPVWTLAVPPIHKASKNQSKISCDLLVTTPSMLVSLLNSRDIDITRLCHLVIENCDKILDTYFDDLNIILNITQSMLNKRVCNNPVQFITTAECWTPPLENLIKRVESVPVVYIGTFLEAALYGRANLQLNFVNSKLKVMSLIEILDQNWKINRTVVLFNENSEIDEVKEHLQVQGINALFIYDFTSKFDVEEMERRWLNTLDGNHLVLLCTDQVFNNTLKISSAFVLVHYSLPNTWTQFITRFSCLIESYNSPLTKKVDTQSRSQVNIFIDENCNQQYSRLIKLLVRMGAKLSDEYCEFYKKLVNEQEQDNIQSKIALCSKLKLLGECQSHKDDVRTLTHQEATFSFISQNCTSRHVFSRTLDKSDEVPNCGTIKYKILKMKGVHCFAVKLLEWTDTKGKNHTIETYDDLDKKLEEALESQKISVGNATVNNLYVHFTETEPTYLRCVVLKVIKVERITKRPSVVVVRFLDTGEEKKVNTVDLYEMPSEFKQIPSQSVDLCIANMTPPHLDDSWSSQCLKKVATLFQKGNCERENVFGNSRIVLRLGDVLWVDNVLLRETTTTSNVTLTHLNLKKQLLDAKLATCSDNQLTKLYDLCEKAGIVLPDYNLSYPVIHVAETGMQQVTPQWAFLDSNDDCIEIYSVCIHTPDLFYVRLRKFENLLLSLQKDIQVAIANPMHKSEFKVEVGKYYLAKDPGSEEFCRVKVTSIQDEQVSCFYVDYGDFAHVNKSSLKFLPDIFITKLPFQAIECRLYGLAPVLDEWQDNAISIMDFYTFEPNTDIFRILYCKVGATEKSENTLGKKYSVIVVDFFKKKVVYINKQLIDCGEAIPLEGEDLDDDFQLFTESEEESLDEKYDEIVQNNNEQETYDESCCDEEEQFLDFEIVNFDLLGDELADIFSPPQRSITSKADPQLPPMTALPPSDHFTPKVVWHQTNTHIKLNIELIGVENFDLRVLRQKILTFKALCDEKKYQLDLQLFDKVVQRLQTSNSGLQIRLTMEKCVPTMWPRLLLSTQKMQNIKYDISKCEIDEDEENKKFLDFGDDFQDDLMEGDDGVNIIDYDTESSTSDIESIGSD